ncbi:uncharacterized protein JN550_003030 [Neoarthrinium moseri]|uniref:uncharacterized protein n=1 Tax=Neoarthrinium moseri TaxID=1658444 RepID=UPI001FDB0B3D|nr:uncharacterized protein JN550_003030 [Neoarthrinium moseri]KAI1873761.1 hypothetical protein JN550_003030 [Neoarthrinium moseri]
MGVTARDDSKDWHLTLEVGSKKWHIGNADAKTFEDAYMKKVCGANGCDGGSPQSFDYRFEDAGYTSKGKGSITMTGSVDNDKDMMNAILDQVEKALVASADCSTVKAKKCLSTYKRNPETPQIAQNCHDIEFQKAQVTFSAKSDEPKAFSCGATIGLIGGALTAFSFPAMGHGAAGIANALCAATTA